MPPAYRDRTDFWSYSVASASQEVYLSRHHPDRPRRLRASFPILWELEAGVHIPPSRHTQPGLRHSRLAGKGARSEDTNLPGEVGNGGGSHAVALGAIEQSTSPDSHERWATDLSRSSPSPARDAVTRGEVVAVGSPYWLHGQIICESVPGGLTTVDVQDNSRDE